MSAQVENAIAENQEIIIEGKKRLQSEDNKLSGIDENTAKKQKVEQDVKIKKRNFALMLGYLGKNYYGMQRNPGMATVEESLIDALLKADLINSEAFETIQTIHFQRAARTDKGVSAARQVVSLKLPEHAKMEDINKFLPNDIRVFGLRRVTKGFNSKSQCDARTYSYTLPTIAFVEESPEILNKQFSDEDVVKRIEELSTINGKPYTEFRIANESIEKLRKVLQLFEGSHNFYNFTSKVKSLDPRARRFIIKFECSEPFLMEGIEFITLKIKGQSFMLHQIRKMIGLTIGIVRNVVTEDILDLAFNGDKMDVPMVPGLGLVLNIVHYDYYNNKFGKDGIHETLDWLECEEEVQKFFNDNIIKHIVQTEISEKSFLTWLGSLPHHTFSKREEHRNGTSNECNKNNQTNENNEKKINDDEINESNKNNENNEITEKNESSTT
ncbi:pseudouridylate synthase 1 homolog isoform X2 [Leptopilina boulardi]|nr:pseudouridylate synthase 1 homolog isoform X2 [Leptopilina boulardi]